MKIGIICAITDEIHFPTSFYYAFKNIFDSVKIVNSYQDLDGLDLLFIGGDHYLPHVAIWRNENFIKTANHLGLKVCVYTIEKIFNKLFPWNWDIQNDLQKFDNLYQRVLDVDDGIKLNKKVGVCPLSINYKNLTKEYEKKDGICFIGSTYLPNYQSRKTLLDSLQKRLKIDSYDPSPNRSWLEYMNLLASYKFVLNLPSTNLNGFCGRLWESMVVKSIPLQHVYSNTLSYYPKLSNRNDIIFYQNEEELIEKIQKNDIIQCDYSFWMEDEILDFLREDLKIVI